jgi:hypothetical protein
MSGDIAVIALVDIGTLDLTSGELKRHGQQVSALPSTPKPIERQ